MTVFLTILAGVTTFVLGQMVLMLIIDPVHEFRRVVADISHALIQDAQVIWNPGLIGREMENAVSDRLGLLSSRLNAQMYLIPRYECTRKVFGLPSTKDVTDAANHLIGLSNSLYKSTADIWRNNDDKT